MKALYLLPFVVLSQLAFAENRTEQSPITMEQLMSELRIQGGNFKFAFESPVYARVIVEISDENAPTKIEKEVFTSDSANRNIELLFTASEMFVGNYPGAQEHSSRKMTLRLSDCQATAGGRLFYYFDKFKMVNGSAKLNPSVSAVPAIGKEYILHWYFNKGDPFYAKAVIEFFANKPEKE